MGRRFRHRKLLCKLGPLFLTQQEVCEFYNALASQAVEEEANRLLVAFRPLSDSDDTDLGSFFRGFLVKAYSERLDALILVPIHTVQPGGEDGTLVVEVRMQEKDGKCVGNCLPTQALWPTQQASQETACREPGKTLCDGDVYYILTMTELHGEQYLFPVQPSLTRFRKRLLRRLSELLEWRTKERRCSELSQLASDTDDKVQAAKQKLTEYVDVRGLFRLLSDSEKVPIWKEIEELQCRRRDYIAEAEAVGFDEGALEQSRRTLEKLIEIFESTVVDEMQKAAAVTVEEHRLAAAAARAAAAAAWEDAGQSPTALRDPRRQGSVGGCVGPVAARGWPPGASRLPLSEAGAAASDYDSPRAAKRLRTQHDSDDGVRGSQGGSSPRPTQLQMDFMHAKAQLLLLLWENGVGQDDDSEDWSKLLRDTSCREAALKLQGRCTALEAQLLAGTQTIPSQVQVAQAYALLQQQSQQKRDQLWGQQEGVHGRWQQPHAQQQLGEEQGPGGLHYGGEQQYKGTRLEESLAQAHGAHAGRYRRQPQQEAAPGSLQHPLQLPSPRPRDGAVKWTGRILLGRNATVTTKLKSGSIWAVPMERPRAPAAGCTGTTAAPSISNLRNSWIPLEHCSEAGPLPDEKELIPEIGVLSFGKERDLQRMAGFMNERSGRSKCCMTSLVFKDGVLAGQEMTTYVMTRESALAQQKLVGQLPSTQKQLFLENKAFLLLFRLVPHKPLECADKYRGAGAFAPPSGGRERRRAPATTAGAEPAGDVAPVAARAVATGPAPAAAAAAVPAAAELAAPILGPAPAAPLPAGAALAAATTAPAVVAAQNALPESAAPSKAAAVAGSLLAPQQDAVPGVTAAQQSGNTAPVAPPVPPTGPITAVPTLPAAPQPGTSTQPEPVALHPDAVQAAAGAAAWPASGASYAAGAYPPPQSAYLPAHWGSASQVFHGAQTAYPAYAGAHMPYQMPYNAATYYPAPHASQAYYAPHGYGGWASWQDWTHGYGASSYVQPAPAPQQPYAAYAPAGWQEPGAAYVPPAADQAQGAAASDPQAAPPVAGAETAAENAPWRALDPEPVRTVSGMSMSDEGNAEGVVAGPAQTNAGPKPAGPETLDMAQWPVGVQEVASSSPGGEGHPGAVAPPAAVTPLPEPPLIGTQPAPPSPQPPQSPPPQSPPVEVAGPQPEREASPPIFSSGSDGASSGGAPLPEQPPDTPQHPSPGPPQSPPPQSPPVEVAGPQPEREASPPFFSSSDEDSSGEDMG